MDETPSEFEARPVEVVLLSGLLVLFAFFAYRWGIEGLVHSRKIQIIPDLRGKPVSSALDLVSPLNLAIRKEGDEFNNAVPIGAILRQTPPAGTKVREGKVVRVVVSQGGATVFAPDVVGLPQRNAEMLLRQSQLSLGEVSESYSLRLEKGMVMSQDPKAESSVERNSQVRVVVSGGAPPAGIVLMPDFLRKNLTDVSSWASTAGLQMSVNKDYNSVFPYGVVLAQDPQPDSVLSQGARVQVTVSGKSSSGGQAAIKNLHYEVPQGSADSLVRVVVMDQYGEREVFNGSRSPGSKIDIPVPDGGGKVRMKVFLNGILVEERDL